MFMGRPAISKRSPDYMWEAMVRVAAGVALNSVEGMPRKGSCTIFSMWLVLVEVALAIVGCSDSANSAGHAELLVLDRAL